MLFMFPVPLEFCRTKICMTLIIQYLDWIFKCSKNVYLNQWWLFTGRIIQCIFFPLNKAAAAAKSLQSCPTLCDPVAHQAPTRLPRPWDSPGKNTGVGCHCLLQCMKGKSESEVAQSCPTLSDPMDCSLPGSSIHGIFQAESTGVGCHCLLR